MERTPAAELIAQEIGRRGPIDFSRFLELALYHPQYGYYSRQKPQRGRAGDYFTSLQVSPLFARIAAETIRLMRQTLESSYFTLIEVGGGDGELLEGILEELYRRESPKGLRVMAVERSRSARDRIWRRLSRFPKCQVVPSLEEADWSGASEGCVISNEFFDALPFHRLRFQEEGWREISVGAQGGVLRELEQPLSDPSLVERAGLAGAQFPFGHELEIREGIPELYVEWGRWLSRGYVLTFDYGYPRAQLYSPARGQGTWLCYGRHQANQDPYQRVGEQDITAHVDFSQLAEAGQKTGFDPILHCSQGVFLTHTGRDIIEGYLAEEVDPVERGRRRGAVQQLVHPQAMGNAFSALLQAKSVDLPSGLAGIPNRIPRLSEPLIESIPGII